MGKAERAAAARARGQRAQAEAQERLEKEQAAAELRAMHQRIEVLRVQALRVLEASGWPDGELIKPYGAFKRKRAAWRAGNILTFMHGEPGSRPLYLLSNGRWGAPDDSEVSTVDLLRGRPTSGIEEGLQRLIEIYG